MAPGTFHRPIMARKATKAQRGIAATKDARHKRTQSPQRSNFFSLCSLCSFAAKILAADENFSDNSTKNAKGVLALRIFAVLATFCSNPVFRSRDRCLNTKFAKNAKSAEK